MALTSQDNIIALFGEFVQLRKTGYDRDEAWQLVEPKARGFAQRDVERLFALLRNWESTEGRQCKPRRDSESVYTTQPVSGAQARVEPVVQPPSQARQDAQAAQAQSQAAPAPASESRLKSLIRPLVQKTGLLSKPNTQCPACGKPNLNGEVVCVNCGQVLVGSHKAQKVGSTRPMEAAQNVVAYFGEKSVLYMRLPDVAQPLAVHFADTEMVVGRTVAGSVMIPDVDLSPYEAERYGVSRLHVSLKRHGETLVISDLDSMNHTFVNGQRLHPHEVRVLNDGDEVRLGWMPVRIFFQHGD